MRLLEIMKSTIWNLKLAFFTTILILSATTQLTYAQAIDSVFVTITEDKSVWEVKSCFDDSYRLKKPNTSDLNQAYIYEDQKYFASDGCFTLYNRLEPDLEKITDYLLEITTIKREQIFYNFKSVE